MCGKWKGISWGDSLKRHLASYRGGWLFLPEFLPYCLALSIKPRSDYPVGTRLISFASVSQLLVWTEMPGSLYLSNAPSYPAVSIKPSLPCPFWSTQWSINLTQYSHLPYLLSFFPLASMLTASQFPSSLFHISCQFFQLSVDICPYWKGQLLQNNLKIPPSSPST